MTSAFPVTTFEPPVGRPRRLVFRFARPTNSTEIQQVELVYCADARCGAGQITTRWETIPVGWSSTFVLPVHSNQSGIYLSNLSFDLSGQRYIVTPPKGAELFDFNNQALVSIQTATVTQAPPPTPWLLIVVLYVILYFIIGLILSVTFDDAKWLGWPYFALLYFCGYPVQVRGKNRPLEMTTTSSRSPSSR